MSVIVINGKRYEIPDGERNIVVRGNGNIVSGGTVYESFDSESGQHFYGNVYGNQFSGGSIVNNKKNALNIDIKIEGNIDTLKIEYGNCTVNRNVSKLDVGSGDVDCQSVIGSVNTGSGNVNCGNVGGDIFTGSGNIKCHEIKGDAKTGSGNISIKR